jgi:hypothetical protein
LLTHTPLSQLALVEQGAPTPSFVDAISSAPMSIMALFEVPWFEDGSLGVSEQPARNAVEVRLAMRATRSARREQDMTFSLKKHGR